MRHPDQTIPAVREYSLQSCNACLRIAGRRKIFVGENSSDGTIEAISCHTTRGEITVFFVDQRGTIVMAPIDDVVSERSRRRNAGN